MARAVDNASLYSMSLEGSKSTFRFIYSMEVERAVQRHLNCASVTSSENDVSNAQSVTITHLPKIYDDWKTMRSKTMPEFLSLSSRDTGTDLARTLTRQQTSYTPRSKLKVGVDVRETTTLKQPMSRTPRRRQGQTSMQHKLASNPASARAKSTTTRNSSPQKDKQLTSLTLLKEESQDMINSPKLPTIFELTDSCNMYSLKTPRPV